ncbi:MAG: glycoside hydrolase family 3 C-terminal domain-containing protein [Solirubrobacterales bacterium]|nr:glycoside hydrolase family 3 C-terminal domain-containing protein [Solirubrobacterales bacterium]
MRRIYAVLSAAIVVAAAAAVIGVTSGAAAPRVIYMDPSAPIPARVHDLLRRMTLTEKVGQMDQAVVGLLRDTTNPANGVCNGGNTSQPQTNCLQKVLITDATGSVLSGGTDNPPGNTGTDWANLYNTIQHYAIDNSRLHIPIIYGVDAVHGFGHPTAATLFPQSIGMGATWDTQLARLAGQATRDQICSVGTVWDFAPVQDVARDNRWGRYYETWGEEPALSGGIGAANIRGMQSGTCPTDGRRVGLRVAATVKHFAAYSESINGHDRVEEQIPIRYLQDLFLPSYGAGINAGADTVMVNSGSINGIPATASHFLLTTELRQRLGFTGVVISDYNDVFALQTNYHIAANTEQAVTEAVNAGVDMAMNAMSTTDFNTALIAAVHDGLVPMWRINQAVTRILTLKFKLGLFDHPYVNPAAANAAVSGHVDLSHQAADESMTLLQNQNGILPLSTSSHVTVVGPNADSIPDTLGGWSVSWQGVYDNNKQACCGGPQDQIPPAVTAWKGIQALDGNATLAADQNAAVNAAGSTDAYVAVVGETRPYAEGLGDDPSPQLDASQKALLAALKATGKPVIVVVVAGRPIGLGPDGESANAILMAWQGSTQAGNGVADVLFGKYNPSGKLPVTWPSDAPPPGLDLSSFDTGHQSPAGDQPHFFDQFPGTNSGNGSGYDPHGGPTRQPLFPFGFGLSYTTFSTSGLSVAGPAAGVVIATFTVANTGSREGVDIVPVYVKRPLNTGEILTPANGTLVGWARVDLMPSQSRQVSVGIRVSQLAVTPGDINGDGPRQVQPGDYQVVLDPAANPPVGPTFTIH